MAMGGGGIAGGPAWGAPTERAALVGRTLEAWARRLIDLSRNNSLLYLRMSRRATIDLSGAAADAMGVLLSGAGKVTVQSLFPGAENQRELTAQLREIGRRALSNLEEKGLDTLALAVGRASWPSADGGTPIDAPIFLLPACLEQSGSRTAQLSRQGPGRFNPVLAEKLRVELGLRLGEEDPLCSPSLGDDGFEAEPLYEHLRGMAAGLAGLEVAPRTVLGNFTFQKMAMVNDLRRNPEAFVANNLIAAIAGDEEARRAFQRATSEIKADSLDSVRPEDEFLIRDADSSQQCAIANAIAGQDMVIHGPPGTGKSQTIANLIAALAASGKRTLFVAEKRAALEVVQQRLSEVGLAHLALDLHGAGTSTAKAMRHVAGALDAVRASPPQLHEDLHTRFSERRSRLNNHVRRVHALRAPTGMSVFSMQGEVLKLPTASAVKTRWRGAALQRLTPEVIREASDRLREAAGLESLFLGINSSPWTGARIADGAEVKRATDLVHGMIEGACKRLYAPLTLISGSAGFSAAPRMAEIRDVLGLIAEVHDTLDAWAPEVFGLDLAAIIAALAPRGHGRFRVIWRWLVDPDFRQARQLALKSRCSRRVPTEVLYGELQRLAVQLHRWRQLSPGGALPCRIPGFNEARADCATFLADFDALCNMLPNQLPGSLTPDGLMTLLRRLATDPVIFELPKLAQIESGLQGDGLQVLIEEIRRERPPARSWEPMLRYAWLASCLDAAYQDDPELRGFRGATHLSYVAEFAQLDQKRLALAAGRVRHAHAEHAVRAMNEHPEQEVLIRAEAAKSRRHRPLRKIFAEAAEVLTSVCPCFMASPLSVSQLLEARAYFDFVIFDEASQILPEDAAAAVVRGRHVVIAGDAKQLPPTTFFTVGNEDELAEEEEADPAAGFESLLEMANPFLRSRHLDWHYRSRDEALIRFSNHYIYGGRLITFPSPATSPAVTFEPVEQQPAVDGDQNSNAAEVNKVVDLVLQHMRRRPQETLGVITMGIRHMYRVQAAVDAAMEAHPDLLALFDPDRPERFFVKNLERVQGDERDAIIVSVGYGKDGRGRLPLRFGPLLGVVGRRRLNVAVTRARRRLTMVSSFRASDIAWEHVRAGTGVELLRNYLDYAASGCRRLGDAEVAQIPLNDFEQDIFDVLSGLGMALVPQVGASGYRIDMAAKHPHRPGEFVLAIECDGASYHSRYTARDRDRLRQQQLEALGWRFLRIWSTDWFQRKAEEVERAFRAYQDAIIWSDRKRENREPPAVQAAEATSPGAPAGDLGGRRRGPRPRVPPGKPIAGYSAGDLMALIRWIRSDGLVRSDEEVVAEVTRELGFARRGRRIETEIRAALQMLGAQ